MPSNLPKTYKVAVFKESGKPLTFEDRELKLPKDGEVLESSHGVHAVNSDQIFLDPDQSTSLWCLPL